MTCHSQLEVVNWVRERDALYTEDPHSVGMWILKITNWVKTSNPTPLSCLGKFQNKSLFYKIPYQMQK